MDLVRRLVVRPTDDSHRVTTLELFFDLVFVFALTQVTALMAGDPTVRGLGRGLVLLALLWFGWSSYAWLGNQARADEGLLRVAMIAAMGALFVVALAIPESYDDKPGGLFAPFVLAACYATVRIAHLVVYLVAAGDDRALRRQLLIQAVPDDAGPAAARRRRCGRPAVAVGAVGAGARRGLRRRLRRRHPGLAGLQRARTSPNGTG